MNFYAPFTLPFIVGALIMLITLLAKWGVWFIRLNNEDKRRFFRGLFSSALPKAVWEMFCEALLHRRIWRVNPLLGYMHTSLAFGWFLLILVGWIETVAHLGWVYVPLQGHVFFKYFATGLDPMPFFDFWMDFLLLVVLSGVALAWFKRVRSSMMGMRRTTKHFWGDRLALSALWCIFPLRLLAESLVCACYGGGGFLTSSVGRLFAYLPDDVLITANELAWWLYSLALGTFFVAMPFSRYMHIFTEIPLILLRKTGLRVADKETSFDNFHIQACSRCGICIDPCQLQSTLGHNKVQSVYFLRDRRYNQLDSSVVDNCLMCGRCESRCPVGIDLMKLRQNSRTNERNTPAENRYNYLQGIDRSQGEGNVGYFAGCMTLRTPRILLAMERIFKAAQVSVWWADRDGGVCCGRPLQLAGEVDAARRMMDFNKELFQKHHITTLVTSCPICLRVFKEEYALDGIEVLHHSEYLLRLLNEGRICLEPSQQHYTYHDPCELGRGCGIYDEPRELIKVAGVLLEPKQTREDALCCGSSLANLAISDAEQLRLARDMVESLEKTDADVIVTACPLCKKAIGRAASTPTYDLSEVVANALKN